MKYQRKLNKKDRLELVEECKESEGCSNRSEKLERREGEQHNLDMRESNERAIDGVQWRASSIFWEVLKTSKENAFCNFSTEATMIGRCQSQSVRRKTVTG